MKDYLKKLDEAYRAGEPLVPDAVYDELVKQFGDLDTISAEKGDIKHSARMYSLNKYYEGDTLPSNMRDYFETPKLDGNAVSTLFADSKLQLGLTRGDGWRGKDITQKMASLCANIQVPSDATIQVTGEVVGSKRVENSRNIAAGILNTKDFVEFKTKATQAKVEFVAYGVQIINAEGFSYPTDNYVDDMLFLEDLGFRTVLSKGLEEEFPTDGIVYRIKDNKKFLEAGFTDKFPKGAFALKEVEKYYVTTLLDVEWQTSKTGRINPVAILDPVNIDGAMVARATLNNPKFIKSLGLEIGSRVKVIRQGKIIPCILGLADELPEEA